MNGFRRVLSPLWVEMFAVQIGFQIDFEEEKRDLE